MGRRTPRRASSTTRALAAALLAGALTAPAAQAAWTSPQTLIPPTSGKLVASALTAAGNPSGLEAFAWVVQSKYFRRGGQGIGGYLSSVRARVRTAGGRLGKAQTVSGPGVIVIRPSVGVDDRGTAFVSWLQLTPGQRTVRIMASVRRPGGRFGAPVRLGTSFTDDELHSGRPVLAVAPGGAAVVAWNQGRRMQAVRRPPSCPAGRARACFGPVQNLGRSIGAVPVAAFGRGGTAYVAWSGTGTRIRLAIAVRARFDFTQAVSPAGVPASSPAIAGASNGDLVMAWRQSPNDTAAEAGFGPIVTATREDDSGAIGAQQTVDAMLATRPQVRTNAQGEAILAWEHDDGTVLSAVRPAGPAVLDPGQPGVPVTFGPKVAFPEPTTSGVSLAVRGDGTAAVLYSAAAGVIAHARPLGGAFAAAETVAPTPAGTTDPPLSQALVAAGTRLTAVWFTPARAQLADRAP